MNASDDRSEFGRQASNPDTARNLLFGILALQNNFIDRTPCWPPSTPGPPTRPGRWAGSSSSRASSTRAAMSCWRPWSREHLKLHGDDPERSLAALSSLGASSRDLEQLADPDLAMSLGHVRGSRSTETGADATLSWAGSATSGGARFRILRPHARGGLGEVFVALDEELHREVALKEIQDRHADDPDSRARFLLEAEITGGLEHPGIVPVYGLGHVRRRPPLLRHAVHPGRQPQGGHRAVPRGRPGPEARPRRAGAGAAAAAAAGSSTSATRSPTPTAGACCTAT